MAGKMSTTMRVSDRIPITRMRTAHDRDGVGAPQRQPNYPHLTYKLGRESIRRTAKVKDELTRGACPAQRYRSAAGGGGGEQHAGAGGLRRSASRGTPSARATQTKQSPPTSKIPRSVITRFTQPSAVAGRVSRLTSLALAVLGGVVLQHHQPAGAGGQIHRAAHPGDEPAGDGPVGQVAVAGDLQPAENRQVDVAAADHGERLRRVEHAGAGERGHRLLAGVDEAGVDLVLGAGRGPSRGGRSPTAASRWRRVDVVRHLGRHPNPQVDHLPRLRPRRRRAGPSARATSSRADLPGLGRAHARPLRVRVASVSRCPEPRARVVRCSMTSRCSGTSTIRFT